MAILNRIRAALNPRVKIEEIEGPDVFTPIKDLGEAIGAGYGIETPRARGRREQREALRQAELGMIEGRLGSQLQGLLDMDAESDTHRAIVSDLAERSAIVSTMLRSQFPEMQQAGVAELSTLMGEIRESGLAVEQRRVRDAELEAAGLKDAWTAHQQLSDDLRQESGAFLEQRAAFGRIKASITDPSSAGDMALIFNFMKLLDPASTVREGEFATAQNAGGVPDIVLTAYNNMLRNGERLDPERREDFATRSAALYEQAVAEQRERNGRYLQQGRNIGVPENWLGDLALPVESPGEMPGSFGEKVQAEIGTFGEGAQSTASAFGQAYGDARNLVADTLSASRDETTSAGRIRDALGFILPDTEAATDRAVPLPDAEELLPASVYRRAQRVMQSGDSIVADPETGRVFIQHEDGSFAEVQTDFNPSAGRFIGSRGDVQNSIRRQGMRGQIQRPTN